MDVRVAPDYYSYAAVHIGRSEGHLRRALRIDGRRCDGEIRSPRQYRRKPALGLHNHEFDFVRVAQEVFGDKLGEINLEPNELPLFVGESKWRRGAVGCYNKLVALEYNIKARFLGLSRQAKCKRKHERECPTPDLTESHYSSFFADPHPAPTNRGPWYSGKRAPRFGDQSYMISN